MATLLDVRDGSPAEPDRWGEPMLGELLSAPGLGDAFTDKPVELVLGVAASSLIIITNMHKCKFKPKHVYITIIEHMIVYIDFKPLIQIRF